MFTPNLLAYFALGLQLSPLIVKAIVTFYPVPMLISSLMHFTTEQGDWIPIDQENWITKQSYDCRNYKFVSAASGRIMDIMYVSFSHTWFIYGPFPYLIYQLRPKAWFELKNEITTEISQESFISKFKAAINY